MTSQLLKPFLILTTAALALNPFQDTLAQTITPAADGTGTIINHNGNTYHITGGTQAGANLFHSFQQFGLQPNEIADFLSNPAINNVVGRVIGGDPSVVEGLIRLSGGNSNLFLVNPAGWVFTDGARVDVPGSFGVTTANRIGFGSEFFNAIGDNEYDKLTGNPTSLLFDSAAPGAIYSSADLKVDNGSLWMVGGSVISTGTLSAPNGTVTFAAIPGQNQVRLTHEGMALSLVLDALPTGTVAAGTPVGLQAADLPGLLNGLASVGDANRVAQAADGSLWLVGSGMTLTDGDVVISDRVTADQVDLLAAGQVNLSDTSQVQSKNITVVRYPGADDPLSYNFIDSLIQDPETFLYNGEQGSITTLVGSQEDGIGVVTERLADIAAAGKELDGVRIVAEGNEGNFWLGNTWVTDETVHDYTDQISSWSAALTDSADLLLYSCFTALGAAGEALVGTIANLTGADVAASIDLTGSAALGGNWALEHQTGNIELGVGFEPSAIADYTGKLQVFTATDATSLIAAIATANGNTEVDTINLANNITLTAVDNATDGDNGLPSILADGGNKLTINGMGNTISRDASAPDFRLIHIATGAEVEINETTLSGGVADPGGPFGGFFPGADGGAIYNNGTLTVRNSTLTGNSARDDGGAISSYGNATSVAIVNIIDTTISGNSAGGNGGGLSNTAFTPPLPNSAVMTIANSTITGNFANVGGGVANLGQSSNNSAVVTINNTTVSGNTAVFGGGGVYNRGQAATLGGVTNITNSTIVQNTVTNAGSSAGGVLNVAVAGGANTARITIANSIVAQNTATVHPDVRQGNATNSPIVDEGNNFIGADSQGIFATSTLVGTLATPLDPELLALGDYGGPTQTHIPLPTSPVLNAGSNALATAAGLTTDQRGADRVSNGIVDIGAFEVQNFGFVASEGNDQSTDVNTAFSENLVIQFVETFADSAVPLAGITFTLTPVPGASGASGSFAGATTLTTDAMGLATASIFSANGVAGAHTVTVSSGDFSMFTFNFTNTGSPAPDLDVALVRRVFTDANEKTELIIEGNAGSTVCRALPELDLSEDSSPLEEENNNTEAEASTPLTEHCTPLNVESVTTVE